MNGWFLGRPIFRTICLEQTQQNAPKRLCSHTENALHSGFLNTLRHSYGTTDCRAELSITVEAFDCANR